MAYIQFDINISQPATQLDFAKQIYFVIYNIAKIFLCNVSTLQALMIHICIIGVACPFVRLSVARIMSAQHLQQCPWSKTSPETILFYFQLCAKNTFSTNFHEIQINSIFSIKYSPKDICEMWVILLNPQLVNHALTHSCYSAWVTYLRFISITDINMPCMRLQGCHLGAVSIRKTVLPVMSNPMLKIRRPNGRLIFNMEITIRR